MVYGVCVWLQPEEGERDYIIIDMLRSRSVDISQTNGSMDKVGWVQWACKVFDKT